MVASTCAQATKKKQRMVFYTMPEYEAWKESLGGNTAGWSIKYYKVRKLLWSLLQRCEHCQRDMYSNVLPPHRPACAHDFCVHLVSVRVEREACRA
eukprot:scaffold219561_cov18-Tisochrysis_lutea.AAC.2